MEHVRPHVEAGDVAGLVRACEVLELQVGLIRLCQHSSALLHTAAGSFCR